MPRPAVVIVHGFKGFKDWGMFPPLADRLARAGFVAVSLNLSGAGVDRGRELRVSGALRSRHLQRRARGSASRVLDALSAGSLDVASPSSIGLLGHSRGGGVAMLEAARDDARRRACHLGRDLDGAPLAGGRGRRMAEGRPA